MKVPNIEVGILSSNEIRFQLNHSYRLKGRNEMISGEGTAFFSNNKEIVIRFNDSEITSTEPLCFEPVDFDSASFDIFDVIIGIHFHWERKENQRFKGELKLMIEENQLTAINILPIEDYLISVISSEMSATSSLELLKAHAVISRSWLLAQKVKASLWGQSSEQYEAIKETEDAYIRWYDREDHENFDVCADDHCQRYQGITKVSTGIAQEAIRTTYGELLTYQGNICDARFSKCCGGITEKFENNWEPVPHPYLTRLVDNPAEPTGYNLDLTSESAAGEWIAKNPPAFCNTHEKEILSQVLNDYDLETQDFYRWKVVLTQEQISSLIHRKTGWDFGDIIDLIPVERGSSGRLIRLKIVGTKKTLIIGKELFIRKALSESHLYSSAFVIEKTEGKNNIPETFVLKGAGWGHGVGLCQIGAAVMGAKGYDYKAILMHYFPGAMIEKKY